VQNALLIQTANSPCVSQTFNRISQQNSLISGGYFLSKISWLATNHSNSVRLNVATTLPNPRNGHAFNVHVATSIALTVCKTTTNRFPVKHSSSGMLRFRPMLWKKKNVDSCTNRSKNSRNTSTTCRSYKSRWIWRQRRGPVEKNMRKSS